MALSGPPAMSAHMSAFKGLSGNGVLRLNMSASGPKQT
jgi:hypothetical protein